MFSDHRHVNLLTAQLVAHGVKDFVVCPGSRNGAIVHNLHAMGEKVRLYPITDERSAAFAALGVSLQTEHPCAVCVTSGSALLNTLPAVAEAAAQHIPLLVISADRPEMLIGQLDGQTLPQQGALLPYCRTWQIPEFSDHDGFLFAERLLNDALLSLFRNGRQPAHINVPLTPPLFSFTTEKLPQTRIITEEAVPSEQPVPSYIIEKIAASQCPVLMVGQKSDVCSESIKKMEANNSLLVLPELIANEPNSWRMEIFGKEMLAGGNCTVVHAGGNLIGKRVKEQLRNTPDLRVIRIQEADGIPDTFFHLQHIIRTNTKTALAQLAASLPENNWVKRTKADLEKKWDEHLKKRLANPTQEEQCVRTAAQVVKESGSRVSLHLANSSTVRLAARFFDATDVLAVRCNRGVNGIEGSLSTAAGYSLYAEEICLCITGDLSFFYDSNALWNEQLRGNLRILLINNGGGGIFRHLSGLETSPARNPYIAGRNLAGAKGICESFGVNYAQNTDISLLEKDIRQLLLQPHGHPALLEVILKDG